MLAPIGSVCDNRDRPTGQSTADWMIQRPALAAPSCSYCTGACDVGRRLMDGTTSQVFKEPGCANATKSFLWLACGGPPAKPVINLLIGAEPGCALGTDSWITDRVSKQTDGYKASSRVAGAPQPAWTSSPSCTPRRTNASATRR